MAKEYTTKSGKAIVGWIYKNGRRIPITKSVKDGGSSENGEKGKDVVAKMAMDIKPNQKNQIQSAIKEDRKKRRTDTTDIIDEIKKGKHNSAEKYIGADGHLTPEREKVHDDIIDNTFKGKKPKEGQKVMTMLGGGSASGKGSLPARRKAENDEHSVILDPDEYKKALPGYKEMSKKTKDAAEFYHEESSALTKRAYSSALDAGYDVVYDGTGDGSVGSAMKKIDEARANGYKVNGEYTTVEVEEALKRNLERDAHLVAQGKDSRLPPEDRVRAIHKSVTDVAIMTTRYYDDFALYDNNVPKDSPKILIATGGNGKDLTAVKGREKELKRFLAKGNLKEGVDFIYVDGVVIPINPIR